MLSLSFCYKMFLIIVSTIKFLVNFRKWFWKQSYTSFQRIICVFVITSHAYPLHRSRNFVIKILEICHCQLNFAVVFGINCGNYQNILTTPTFVNSPHWCYILFLSWYDIVRAWVVKKTRGILSYKLLFRSIFLEYYLLYRVDK